MKRTRFISFRWEEFDEILFIAIDESISLLGETVKETLVFLLKKQFGIELKDASKKPREFIYAFRAVLGSSGSKVIEDLILKNLYAKLGYAYEKSGEKDFYEYIEEAKRIFQSIKRESSNPARERIQNIANTRLA